MEMKLMMMEIIMTSMIIIIVVIIIVIIAILIKSSAQDQGSPRDKLLAFSLQRLLLLHWFRCVPPAEDGKSMPLLSSSSSSLTSLLSLYCHQYYEDDDCENWRFKITSSAGIISSSSSSSALDKFPKIHFKTRMTMITMALIMQMM